LAQSGVREGLKGLEPPPRRFSQQALPTVQYRTGNLLRISRFAGGEPYFGRSGKNRFDDDSRPKKSRFGTCYCANALVTAVAETLLHDRLPEDGRFRVDQTELETLLVYQLAGRRLRLANLMGGDLKTLGADGRISTELPAHMPRRWARAIHGHPAQVDGIRYISRHVNDQEAVVLFDRAASKVRVLAPHKLDEHPDFSDVMKRLWLRLQRA
jgi:hypothetical protein